MIQYKMNICFFQNEDLEEIQSTQKDLMPNSKLGSCSEVFTDTLTGYPKYETGFKLIGCDDPRSLFQDVTFLYNFMDQGKYLAKSFGRRISK